VVDSKTKLRGRIGVKETVLGIFFHSRRKKGRNLRGRPRPDCRGWGEGPLYATYSMSWILCGKRALNERWHEEVCEREKSGLSNEGRKSGGVVRLETALSGSGKRDFVSLRGNNESTVVTGGTRYDWKSERNDQRC